MSKHRKLAKKKVLLPRPPDVVCDGLNTHGASNKYWKILSKHILSKNFEAEKPPEAKDSPISMFKQFNYSPRDSPTGKTAKVGAAFAKSELIKILDQSWVDQCKEEQFWKDLTIGQEVYDRL